VAATYACRRMSVVADTAATSTRTPTTAGTAIRTAARAMPAATGHAAPRARPVATGHVGTSARMPSTAGFAVRSAQRTRPVVMGHAARPRPVAPGHAALRARAAAPEHAALRVAAWAGYAAPLAVLQDLRSERVDLEEPAVGADHEARGDRGAVRAGGEVRDVALDPGQGPRFVLQFAVDALGGAV